MGAELIYLGICLPESGLWMFLSRTAVELIFEFQSYAQVIDQYNDMAIFRWVPELGSYCSLEPT